MFNKNSLPLGILAGCILPGIAWLIFEVIYKGTVIMNRPAMPYLIAIGLNLLLIRILHSKGAEDTGRGVMLASFICMVLVVIFKIRL
ncbi:hypothetical protein [uncultured Mucilaginibacter sp.]|uniref:hypothetical protein n=1 Tax=uncultured Mucilaginibacter sp. TaxID=797541 RepID=UPI0025E1B004|nr:hypothetical protein [uncultured Mucilaginibacter sp.]